MKAYQLIGEGDWNGLFEGTEKFVSEKIYLSKDTITDKIIEEFKIDSAIGGGGFASIYAEDISVKIIEVEIVW